MSVVSKPTKLSLLVAVAIGYVLGARAGRARYEQIAGLASRVTADPRVQAAASKAQETVAQQAPAVAHAVKDKVTDTFTNTFTKDEHSTTVP